MASGVGSNALGCQAMWCIPAGRQSLRLTSTLRLRRFAVATRTVCDDRRRSDHAPAIAIASSGASYTCLADRDRPAAVMSGAGQDGGTDELFATGIGSVGPEPEPETVRSRRQRAHPSMPSSRGRPRRQFGPSNPATGVMPATRADDPALWAVHDELLRLDPTGARTGNAFREAFDQVYDGERTGRWDYTQLMKTEKTHLGTLVEIWLQREFRFRDGDRLDYSIAGEEVDAKWSRNLYEWEIPLEMYTEYDEVALVLWANEDTVRWAAGLMRMSDAVLKPLGRQRDQKRRLNDVGRDRIVWVHRDKTFVRNTLLHIDPAVAAWIAAAESGQAAVNILFREVQGVLIDRASFVAAGQQVDAAKRVRDARGALRSEGIVIFGHYRPHPDLAASLGLPRPSLGGFVSARLTLSAPGDVRPSAVIDGGRWRIADPVDRPVIAPRLPRQGTAD